MDACTLEMSVDGERSTVCIDIGGVHFVTCRDTLLNIPNTRLAALANRPGADLPRVFFDRNSFLFEYILDFYRTGELHIPSGRCGLSIKSELEFWGLDETCISICCWKTYVDSIEEVTTQARIRKEFSRLYQKRCRPAEKSLHTPFREKLWTFLEYPQSSSGAKVYSVIGGLLVIVSLVVVMLGTLPDFHIDPKPVQNNDTTVTDSPFTDKLHLMSRSRPVEAIIYTDFTCIALVTLEFLIKLIVCPDRCTFLKSFSTFSDLVLVLPVGIILVLEWIDPTVWLSDTYSGLSLGLQSMIALRVLRLHRLVRPIRGFVVLALSLKASGKELLLLIALALSASVVFAFAIYFAELTQDDTFPHAFMGMWWSLITMTSVGYGDVYPKTPIGYVVGGTCAISGLILISLPVPLIANNFNTYYAHRERQERRSHCVWNGKLRSSDVHLKKSMVYERDQSAGVTRNLDLEK